MPTADTSSDDRAQDERDDRQAGHELAVDDVVAVDRLRQQPRQGAVGALALMASKPNAMPRSGPRSATSPTNDGNVWRDPGVEGA